jgi:hypothetical protein
MGLLPKPSFCRNPFLSEINGDVDRQSRDSHSGPGTPLLFLQPSLPVDPEGPEEDVEMENSVPSDKTSSFYEGGALNPSENEERGPDPFLGGGQIRPGPADQNNFSQKIRPWRGARKIIL